MESPSSVQSKVGVSFLSCAQVCFINMETPICCRSILCSMQSYAILLGQIVRECKCVCISTILSFCGEQKGHDILSHFVHLKNLTA